MCFIKFAYNPIYICLKTGLCIEYGWVIRVFFHILIIYQGKIIKKNFKSKIYGKLTTIKVILLSFRLYLFFFFFLQNATTHGQSPFQGGGTHAETILIQTHIPNAQPSGGRRRET